MTKNQMTTLAQACPCGAGKPYAVCCGPLHQGALATSAEALMRSRYSAYVLGDMQYVADSWHPSTRPGSLENDASARWLGLKIKAARQLSPDQAEVEFVARYRQGGSGAVRLHEVSRFVREDGRWFYLDGQFSEV